MATFFDTPIEYLKGIGPQRALLLNKELKIFTYGDLVQHYPFRYEDRTRFYGISEILDEMPYVQLKGRIVDKEIVGVGRTRRLVAHFSDGSGQLELVWFQGISWISEKLKTGIDYIVFGKPVRYGKSFSIAHPEVEPFVPEERQKGLFHPVYSVTEKLRSRRLDSRVLARLIHELLRMGIRHVRETLPPELCEARKLVSKQTALVNIHFPDQQEALATARRRLKFEELFYMQLRLLKLKLVREEKFRGATFSNTSLLNDFYKHHLPFQLTQAQKRVIREIYTDLRSGKQMNRLLQGDVGSGKTMVAFICMLIAIGSGAQCALMAPTEILAQQHYKNLLAYATMMNLNIALLTGSVKKAARKNIHQQLRDGTLHLLVGTHALLEEEVQFNNLGLAIVDEQHRFGVAQRSRLWQKNTTLLPHVLVMTATPIPRTLAMTLYGDLDISVIDELPKGRKPIITTHRYDAHRLMVNRFIEDQVKAGRQVYMVYPLIEESEKLDLKHLMDGYESVQRAFPDLPLGILHGRMKPDAKDYEMKRFVKGETKIMVATTVIEVGVDVPNASVMIIENAERFGLSQLHQLRGRVGRGADQSFCILMTDFKISAESKKRIDMMVKSHNGFEIAEADLQLRGPGDLMGTQQSGLLDLTIADLGKDAAVLQEARDAAIATLREDPELKMPKNSCIYEQIKSHRKTTINWSRIS